VEKFLHLTKKVSDMQSYERLEWLTYAGEKEVECMRNCWKWVKITDVSAMN
jgi:hypothetical protein